MHRRDRLALVNVVADFDVNQSNVLLLPGVLKGSLTGSLARLLVVVRIVVKTFRRGSGYTGVVRFLTTRGVRNEVLLVVRDRGSRLADTFISNFLCTEVVTW